MSGHNGPPEEFVESVLAEASPEALDGLLAVLATRRGSPPDEIAEHLDRPPEDVEDWIAEVDSAESPVERLERIGAGITAISGAETVDGIVQPLSDVVEDLLGSTDVVVYRYDGLRDAFVPAAPADGGPFGSEPVDAGDDPRWTVFRSGEPTVLDDSELVVPAAPVGIARIGGIDPAQVSAVDRTSIRPVVSVAAAAVDRIRRIRSLEADRDELRRENEQLRDFASIVSHDLRNPLSVATGAFEMVIETDEEKYVEQVRDAHDRIDGIIDHTLSLAQEGERVADAESVDLETVAGDAWRAVDTRDATLHVEDSTRVDADPERLRQLFENLFRNAVEHGSTGSQASSVPHDAVEHGSTSPRPSGDDAVEPGSEDVAVRVGTTGDGFYVADDGPGIPPSVRDRIFERGYTSADDGTGLGLHIVREVAEGHRWTIDVEESEEDGARFEFGGV